MASSSKPSDSSAYFARFENFNPDPTKGILEQFEQLSLAQSWKKKGKEWHKQRGECLAEEFEKQYGSSASKLESWQELCAEVGVEPAPGSIKKCKQALSKVAVNLVDLIDARRTGKEVKVFRSKAALRNYSMQTNKIFPKKAAKKDGFLQALLIRIF